MTFQISHVTPLIAILNSQAFKHFLFKKYLLCPLIPTQWLINISHTYILYYTLIFHEWEKNQFIIYEVTEWNQSRTLTN